MLDCLPFPSGMLTSVTFEAAATRLSRHVKTSMVITLPVRSSLYINSSKEPRTDFLDVYSGIFMQC